MLCFLMTLLQYVQLEDTTGMAWIVTRRQKDLVAPLVSLHTENAGRGRLPGSIMTVHHVYMYAEMSLS